jgi:hypothetical protein
MHVVVRQKSWQFSRGRGSDSNDNPSGNFPAEKNFISLQSLGNIARRHAQRKCPQSQPGWIDTCPAKHIEEPLFEVFFHPRSTLSTSVATLSNKKFS